MEKTKTQEAAKILRQNLQTKPVEPAPATPPVDPAAPATPAPAPAAPVAPAPAAPAPAAPAPAPSLEPFAPAPVDPNKPNV